MSDSGDDKIAIEVPENPSLEDAVALAALLREAPVEKPLSIDASAVSSMCTPYVLTLICATQARAGLSPPAEVNNAPSAFVDAFTDLGLFKDMMKMEFVG